MRLTTDMGDWTALPRRIRLALVVGLGTAVAIGIAAGIGVIGIPLAALVLANLGVTTQWAFSLRRPWWPAEPDTTAAVFDHAFRREIVAVGLLDIAAAAAVGLRIVRL